MRRYLFYLMALLFVTACSKEFENDNSNQKGSILPGTEVKFLRLQDDSTNVAGMLEINAKMSSVKLQWDVSPECNLDTTITELQLCNGKYNLPIKWADKTKEGTYGPVYSAYIAGVYIIAGDDFRYVPLVWADEVDSLKIVEMAEQRNVLTRGSEEKDAQEPIITIQDVMPVQFDQVNCGSIHFTFKAAQCNIDKADLGSLNTLLGSILNLDGVKSLYLSKPAIAAFKWKTVAPDVDFMGHMKISAGSFIKYAYFQYMVPDPKEWKFVECIPDTLSELPAKNATVVAIANTNRKWSLKYRMENGNDSIVESAGKVSGEQSLLFRLPDNTSLNSRNILIDVYSEDLLVNVLRFTQKAAEGSFSIISVVPVPAADSLSAEKQNIKVTVDTARDWWISYNGIKHNFLASESSGEVEIPAYDGTTSRDVVITVGYDNTLVETYSYTQVAGNVLEYDNSSMPTIIPVDGGTYTYYFHGSFKGNLQVRAVLDDGTVVATSPSTTNKEPSMVIPNNYTSLNERTLIFEYKKGNDDWKKLDESNHVQLEAKFNYAVLPAGNIPREGTTISGVFAGSYRGNVQMKAMNNSIELVSGNSATPGSINLSITELTGIEDRKIEFFYSIDGGTTWNSMGEKIQVAGTISIGTVSPEGNIPADGGSYTCSFSGTYPGNITFRARTGATILDTQAGKFPIRFELKIPANGVADQREVVFEYSKNGTDWVTVDTRIQTSKIPINGGDNNVDDYGEGEIINGGTEL